MNRATHLGHRYKLRQKSVRISRVIWPKCYNNEASGGERGPRLVEAIDALLNRIADCDNVRFAAGLDTAQDDAVAERFVRGW